MATVRFFRDSLTLDANIVALLASAKLTVKPGDTLILGARLCTIGALPGDFNYVIGADELTLASAAPLQVVGTASNRSPVVTILAAEINGALNLVTRGAAGEPGKPGIPGDDAEIIIVNGKPVRIPPTSGGPGGNGGPGSPGGKATIRYITAAQPPVASAPGGAGGAGGPGGAAGKGLPRASNGKAGKAGPAGPAGSAIVTQVAPAEIWATLDSSSAILWSSYRTEVGTYFFRVFDPESQLIAISQFEAALLLNPANLDAKTLRFRIIQRQTPTGLSRDLDISPDYKDLSASLGIEAVLVQNAFAAAAAALQNLQNATGFKNQFTSMVQQLKDRGAEAQDNVKLAEEDVKIANAQEQILADQIRSARTQIDKLQHQSFDLGDFLTTVGGVASAVVSIGTGLAAITSIPAAIVAIDKIDTSFGIMDVLRGEYEFRKDGDPKKDFDKEMSKIGSGLTAFMKLEGNVSGFLANLNAFENELDGAGTKAEQSEAAQLMKELVNLQKQQLVARLRQAQARDRVSAAQRQVQNLASEVQTAQGFLNSWTDTEVFLTQAVDFFIAAARHLVDIVAEDVFIARRALEIYQLDRADDLRFDYGYLHPDQDHSLTPLARVTQSQNSVSALAPSILTWNDLFTRLNVAQSAGFQVVHPAISFSITDPALLAKLSSGGLQFSIDLSAMPPSVFELKVNSMQLALQGASASKLAIVWIEHSGHWRMASRKGGQAEFTLFPHLEAFNCDPATGNLTAKIPAQPPSSAEPGPPFSFWGRGVAADWRVFPDAASVGLDLSKVTALNLTIQCIAFAPIAATQPVTIKPVLSIAAAAGTDVDRVLLGV